MGALGGWAVSYERGSPVGFLLTNVRRIIRAEIDELLESRAFDSPENHHEADLGCPVANNLAGRGTTKAEDAQGTPIQSHISPSIPVYENKNLATAMPPVGPQVFWKKKRMLRGGWSERLSEAEAGGLKAR